MSTLELISHVLNILPLSHFYVDRVSTKASARSVRNLIQRTIINKPDAVLIQRSM